jgi:hypothetical protein
VAITVKVSVKDFNLDKLQEEVTAASLPINGISWAGLFLLMHGAVLLSPSLAVWLAVVHHPEMMWQRVGNFAS